jgi:hypothetical protein
MELGRLIRLTDGAVHSMIKPRLLTKTFVAGDIISFLMQACGQSHCWLRALSFPHTRTHILAHAILLKNENLEHWKYPAMN